jgi:hypothetical protein
MRDPADQPARQTEADCGDKDDKGEQLVRLDMGGWISGPCLDAAALIQPPPGGLAESGWPWPTDERQRPAQ